MQADSEALKAVYDKWSHEMDAELNSYLQILNTTMDSAIADMTKTKKLAVVLNKNVKVQDNTIRFVWGGTDITADVIKSMNDNFKPSMFDQIPAKPSTPEKSAPAAGAPAATPAPAANPAAQ